MDRIISWFSSPNGRGYYIHYKLEIVEHETTPYIIRHVVTGSDPETQYPEDNRARMGFIPGKTQILARFAQPHEAREAFDQIIAERAWLTEETIEDQVDEGGDEGGDEG